MRRESASYWLAFPADAEDDIVATLSRAGAELLGSADERLDYCLRHPIRYWIDVRIHRVPESRLEFRIALTNDGWSIREPLLRALTPLPDALDGRPLRDDEDNDVAVAGAERWWYALEQDFVRRREEFVALVGDFTAPICAEDVYSYLHHARRRRDISEAAEERRAMEIEMLRNTWDESPPPDARGN